MPLVDPQTNKFCKKHIKRTLLLCQLNRLKLTDYDWDEDEDKYIEELLNILDKLGRRMPSPEPSFDQ